MAESKAKAWTEAEKLGVLFQIIQHVDKIPWADLNLPEGRTKKACVVMIDREKQKLKKASAEGKNDQDTPASKKRRFQDNGDDETATISAVHPAKKPKSSTSRAQKPKVKAEPKIEDKEDDEEMDEEIKSDSEQ